MKAIKKIVTFLIICTLFFSNVFSVKAYAQNHKKVHIAKDQLIELLDKGVNRLQNLTLIDIVEEYVEFREDAIDLTLGLASRTYGIRSDSIEEVFENGKKIREFLELTEGALEDVYFTVGVWVVTGSLLEAIDHLKYRYNDTIYNQINTFTSLPYLEYYFPNQDRFEVDLDSWYKIYEPPIAFHNLKYELNKWPVMFHIKFPDFNRDTYRTVPTFFETHGLGLHKNEILIEFDRPVREIADDVVMEVAYSYDYADYLDLYERSTWIQLNQYDTYKINSHFEHLTHYFPSARGMYNALPTNNPNELKITVSEKVTDIYLFQEILGGGVVAVIERFHVLTEAQGVSFEAITNFSSTRTAMIPIEDGEPGPEELIPTPEKSRTEENSPDPDDTQPGDNPGNDSDDKDSSWWNPLNWLWNLLKSLLEKLFNLVLGALDLLGNLLSGLLESIIGVLRSILGFFSDIWDWLTWSESGYLQSRLNGIKETFDSKFPSLSNLFPDNFAEDSKAPTIAINLSHYGVGQQEIVDLNYMQQYFPTFKRWITAFLYLSTTLIIYKKITGDGVND